jgi:hypothetical protein
MRRMPSPQALVLSAVGVVLFLVSVPRVHQFALQDNERDATSSLLILSKTVQAAAAGDSAARQLPLPDTWDQEINCRLYDAHATEGSSVIQRHGYLLELAYRTDGTDFLRAWPTKHGATGRSAYLLDPERGLIEHPNLDGAWSGPSSQRPDGTEPGWRSGLATR